jgi:hypothetical protein
MMKRALAFAVGAVLTVALFAWIGESGASTPLLPGETTFSSGAPAYIFGSNDGPVYASPNVDTLPSVQADIKAAGLTFMRVWSYQGDTKAYVLSKVKAAQAEGATCLFVLGSTGSLAWQEKTLGWVAPYCHLFEFGNEPDNPGSTAGGKISTYTYQWNTDVPQLRALDPSALFGGPVLTWSGSKDASAGNYPSDVAFFLARTAAKNNRADFISYHNYSCTNSTSTADCLANLTGDIDFNWNETIAWETKYYGAPIPTGVSEYNFDPGTANLGAWANDATFMTSYTTAAIDEYVRLGVSFANQYTTLNYAGYGDLDMFSDSSPYAPKPQFNAMAAEVTKYGGP